MEGVGETGGSSTIKIDPPPHFAMQEQISLYHGLVSFFINPSKSPEDTKKLLYQFLAGTIKAQIITHISSLPSFTLDSDVFFMETP